MAKNNLDHNRYEATPYRALEQLFLQYKLKNNARVVDFGCGRGRGLFYIHNRFQVPVTGVEQMILPLMKPLIISKLIDIRLLISKHRFILNLA